MNTSHRPDESEWRGEQQGGTWDSGQEMRRLKNNVWSRGKQANMKDSCVFERSLFHIHLFFSAVVEME